MTSGKGRVMLPNADCESEVSVDIGGSRQLIHNDELQTWNSIKAKQQEERQSLCQLLNSRYLAESTAFGLKTVHSR